MWTDKKLPETQIFKRSQSGGLLGPLWRKLADPLMKVGVPLTENLLPPLEITAVASAIDAEIQKEVHGSGRTTLIISNEKMNGVKKTVQSFKDYNILLKKLLKQMKIEQLNKKEDFWEGYYVL